jgi:hypothetical protein
MPGTTTVQEPELNIINFPQSIIIRNSPFCINVSLYVDPMRAGSMQMLMYHLQNYLTTKRPVQNIHETCIYYGTLPIMDNFPNMSAKFHHLFTNSELWY